MSKIYDFDFYYLALLTKEGIKPLSRWEKEFTSSEINLLKKLD